MEPGFALALLVAFVAGGVQRITGMGFALCATPLLVMIYGAADGVRIVVLLGLILSLCLLLTQRAAVDWRSAWRLTWPGLAASPLGALAVVFLPEAALLLLVGGAAIVSLLAGRSQWLAGIMAGRGATIKAGSAAGLLNLTSGLSGPPLVGYAEAVKMPVVTFIATVQVVFIALDAITIAWRGFPQLPIIDLVWFGLAMGAGLTVASLLARFVPDRWGRRLMFAVAWLGTAAVLAKGSLAVAS